jgi:hypothetical protein
MQPLSVANIDELDQTMYLAGSGTFASIESDLPSFIVHATQYVAGGQSSDDITVRGDMGDNPKWTNPQECLPPVKAVVAFWGSLQQFDSYDPPNTKDSSTCVIVAVHNITYCTIPHATNQSRHPQPIPLTRKANFVNNCELEQKKSKAPKQAPHHQRRK